MISRNEFFELEEYNIEDAIPYYYENEFYNKDLLESNKNQIFD